MMNSNTPVQFDPRGSGYAHSLFVPGTTTPSEMDLSRDFFSTTPAMREQTIAHESLHHALGIEDFGYRRQDGSFVSAYGMHDATVRALDGGMPEAFQNPDNIVFALGFHD
jgi:hypothetical protein